MKPWIVIRCERPEHFANLRFNSAPKRGTRETGILWAPPHDKSRPHDDMFDPNQMIWYVDTESDAYTLAEMLTQRFSGVQFLAVETKMSFKSTPGPIVRAKYTPDGVIPA